jgi:O-antigen biosynthesis protein
MMRVALVDDPSLRLWSGSRNRFTALGQSLRAGGHEIALIDGPSPGGPTFIAGAQREADVAPLTASARMVSTLREIDSDVMILPLRNGLAHGLLMARACGEIDSRHRIALWCDAPTRSKILADDWGDQGLRPLVADALERACLGLADALIAPNAPRLAQLQALQTPLPGAFLAELPYEESAPTPPTSLARPEEIVFVGPLRRAGGVAEFIDAIEGLAASGLLSGISVTFVGPLDSRPRALGKEWFGARATGWDFDFRVVSTDDYARAASLANGARRLIVAAPWDAEEAPASLHSASNALIIQHVEAPGELGARIGETLRAVLQGRGRAPQPARAVERNGWDDVLEQIRRAPPRCARAPAGPVGLSVCVLHHERPAMLATALESVRRQADGDRVELIVVDNASSPACVAALAPLQRDFAFKLARLHVPVPYWAAHNHAASLASKEFIAFLDDDNAFAPGGLARLSDACATGSFDVIASNLELVEDPGRSDACSRTRMTFIGPAQSAGLFFNAFGDTAFAIRRDAFHRLGGFCHRGGPYPGADWAFFSRAQAAGLRIGVVQEPSCRYRRSMAQASANWQRLDQHGVRAIVLGEYGSAFDPTLVAKFAQTLSLECG